MKKAFTLIELIFVIIVIGILSSIALPKMGGGKLQKAADQVVSHIRYTQHLAMVDDKFDANINNWYRARWQIYFKHDSDGDEELVYTIYSNTDLDDMSASTNADANEIAKDPLTSKDLTGDSLYSTTMIKNMNLSSTYGVKISDMDTLMSGGCNQKRRIFFDHLGRPMLSSNISVYEELLTSDCNITLTNSEGSITIGIEPETGYARIL